MSDDKVEKASDAQFVDAHDGVLGQEKQATVVAFARQMLDVYFPHRDASTYARHKPVRILLKAYRTYHCLAPPDRRHQMAANLRQVFQSHPNDVSVSKQDLEEKSFSIVDGFISLVDNLYAGVLSILSRHENELIHAYDLAMDLVYDEVRVIRDKRMAQDLAARVKSMQGKTDLTDEDRARLKEDQRKLDSILKGPSVPI